MKSSWILIIGILCTVTCLAQEKWTYQDCMEYALENNLSLKSFEFDIQRQEKNYTSAIGDFLPSVSANTNYNINQGRTADPNTNQIIDAAAFFGNSYGLGSNLQLFNGFILKNQLKYEKYRLTAAEETYKKQKSDLTYSVLVAYVDHLNNSGLVGIQEEQLALAERELYRIKKNVTLGLSSGSDQYEAEAAVASDEFLYVQLKNRTYTSLNSLKKLLNLPSDTLVEIENIGVIENPVDPSQLASLDQTILPEVKSTMATLQAAKYQLKMTRANITPYLGAYANWNSGYYETRRNTEGAVISYNDQLDLNSSINYGISLNIPIFNKLNRMTNIQRAKINYSQAENNLRIILRDVEYDINEAYQDYLGAIAENEAAQKKVLSFELAFEVAEKKREKGLINIMEFNQSKNDLAVAKAENLRTELQLFLTEKTINFYLTGSFIE